MTERRQRRRHSAVDRPIVNTSEDCRDRARARRAGEMDSLEPKCTGLKNSYDACFNRWFEKYLSLTASHDSGSDQKRVLAQSKHQYEKECGRKWQQYHACLNVCSTPTHSEALESRQLKPLLEAARNEDPLTESSKLEKSTQER
ncbi:uncharacterized protein VP01_556g3 [Puccinia sorghi]|uniref:Uncharacterized protein n=1 Tax=Puccinia sorghi TaxID=27349 RepID=A0A0L6UJ41_9BASI|nr:uncharacterized protein VP01_556g3 [Puccinia sorghi]